MWPEASAAGAAIDRVGGEYVVRRPASLSAQALEVSLAMPCYNEEAAIRETAASVIEAFREAGVKLELVLVDNGSRDRTGAIIDELMTQGFPIAKVEIPTNRGYSHGIRMGLEACRAPIIGYLCADGQVDARDAVNTYHLVLHRPDQVLAKVRRRLRKDSWRRKLVSVGYNGLMYLLFGWLGSIDLNASPKLFSRSTYRRMRLSSDDWFLDPEIMLKARDLGLQVIELNVEGRPRQGGHSHVRWSTIFEFFRNIWRSRWGGEVVRWRAGLANVASAENEGEPIRLPGRFEGVRRIPQARHEDARGFVQKVLTASQCGGHPPTGEVYVTAGLPGESKGHHYHRRMGEWFAVVSGRANLYLADPESGERMMYDLSAATPSAVYVPAGLAHALHNPGPDLMLCVAWAEREHDPADVFPYQIPVDSRGAAASGS